MTNKNIFFLIIFFCYSCSSSTFNSEEELWEHIKDEKNGFSHSENVNGVQYNLLYKPTDLLVKQELREGYTQNTLDSLRKKYRDYAYFSLSMSKNNQELLSGVAGNKQQFGEMVNTLAFGMEEQIHLFTDKNDTVALLDYIYPRMYGMSRSTSLLLVYPKEEVIQSDKINITIGDLGFQTGEVRFTQKANIISQEPSLQL